MNKQILNKAKAVFEVHKDTNKVFVTADGQVFLEKAHNSALFHAKQKGGEKPLKLYEVTRVEAMRNEEMKNEENKDEDKTPANNASAKQTKKVVTNSKK